MCSFSLCTVHSIVVYILHCSISISFTINKPIKPYYISPNRFDFNNADSFCHEQCHSNIASIHSNSDYEYSLSIIQQSKTLFIQNQNVWIGLNDIEEEGNYKYKDGTLFDFGNNTLIGGIYPWKSGSPNNANPSNGYGGQDCIQLTHSFDFLWDDTECNNLGRILCNKCDSVINKYVIINELSYYDEAQTYCKHEIGTDLASVHSLSDHKEILFLCERYENDCWIGLILNEGIFEWTDHTTYKWHLNQSNNTRDINNNIFGTALVSDQEQWFLFNKNNKKRYFLCNLPSNICYKSEWNTININNNNIAENIKWNDCEILINDNSVSNFISILSEKQWINTNNKLVIEYMYKINGIIDEINESNHIFNSGILLFNFKSICDYYEIGIAYINQIYYVYIGKWINGYYNLLQIKQILDEFGIYYKLEIIVIETYKFTIYLNGKLYLDFVDINRNINNQTTNVNNIYSGYIGLINNNLKISAKSLFVSGSQMSINNTQKMKLCPHIIHMQNNLDPESEYNVKYEISIIIIINTKASNITQIPMNIDDILSNITNEIIHNRVNNLYIDINCIIYDKITTNILNQYNILINTTMYSCDKQMQSIITVDFTQH
eukprot:517413_1